LDRKRIVYPVVSEAAVPQDQVGVVYLPELIYTDVLVSANPSDICTIIFVFDRTSVLDNQASLAVGMNNAFMLY
jgi:hypothetical protein